MYSGIHSSLKPAGAAATEYIIISVSSVPSVAKITPAGAKRRNHLVCVLYMLFVPCPPAGEGNARNPSHLLQKDQQKDQPDDQQE